MSESSTQGLCCGHTLLRSTSVREVVAGAGRKLRSKVRFDMPGYAHCESISEETEGKCVQGDEGVTNVTEGSKSRFPLFYSLMVRRPKDSLEIGEPRRFLRPSFQRQKIRISRSQRGPRAGGYIEIITIEY